MLSDSDRMLERLDLLVMAGSRNGLRESGRGGGSSNGEAGLVGDTARLRNGLFEGRFNDNPADRWSKWAELAIRSAGERTGSAVGNVHANDDGDRNMKQ
jgi:hypothetical protein